MKKQKEIVAYKFNQTLIDRGKELNSAVKLEKQRILLGKHKYIERRKSLLSNLYDESRGLNIKLAIPRSDKKDLSLLERDVATQNDFIKKNRVDYKPKVVGEFVYKPPIVEEFKNVTPYDDKFGKIHHYIEKYGISYMRNGRKKSNLDLATDIHKYEFKNLNKLKLLPLDKKYKEVGYYII